MTAAGLDAPVLVRRNPRARRLSLSVNEARRGAVLTVPRYTSLEEAGNFLAKHFEWLQKRLAALPRPMPFADGGVVPLRGQDHVLRFTPNARKRGVVWNEEQPPGKENSLPVICVAGAEEHAPRRLKDWLKRQARADLSGRCAVHAARLDVKPKRITIRDQSTRWGSCSATGALSFSWRLILAPAQVLDYMAAHEVAHLREMNHGARFWAIVRETCATMDEAKAWLRKNGAQ
ncbi:MAG: M48 family metallopeptidase, partial [Methyloligellaceae bacterium]